MQYTATGFIPTYMLLEEIMTAWPLSRLRTTEYMPKLGEKSRIHGQRNAHVPTL